MDYDYIIVGQGIAGILLAFQLSQKGKRLILFDKDEPSTASQCAGAILNPINLNTGKEFPQHESQFVEAQKAYQSLSDWLGIEFVQKFDLFVAKDETDSTKIIGKELQKASVAETNLFNQYFHEAQLAGVVHQVSHVNFAKLKQAWKERASVSPYLDYESEEFDYHQIEFDGSQIIYGGNKANGLIFCEGSAGARNPFFPQQPFTANMGNVLILEIPDIPADFGLHFHHRKIIPLGDHRFWMGSNYEWNFKEVKPNLDWQKEVIKDLKEHLKTPFNILNHLVAERPTTAGQKPLLLRNSQRSNLFFLNGLGTRGFSRCPILVCNFIESYRLY